MIVKGNNNYTAFNSLTINYGKQQTRQGIDSWGLTLAASVSDSIAMFDTDGTALLINNAWGSITCNPAAISHIDQYVRALGAKYSNPAEIRNNFMSAINSYNTTTFLLAMLSGALVTCQCAPVFNGGDVCGVIFIAKRHGEEKLLCRGDDRQSRIAR